MKQLQPVKSLILALLILPLAAVVALATEVATTVALNIRSGPGPGYVVVGTLSRGEVVEVSECHSNGWCFITHPGTDGWVNSNYLTAAPTAGSQGDNCRFELTFGSDGPRFSIVCGTTPDRGPFPGPTPAANRACFYDGPNYTGDYFCRPVGLYNTLPASANNRITSVRLFGNARARLCVDQYMGPFCRDVTGNENRLGPYLDNQVSSLRVYTGTLPPGKQACLYDGSNFTGQHMCFGVGVRTLPPLAQNRTTSVKLFGGAEIRLCKGAPYPNGPCAYRTTDWPAMPPFWNNQTRSIRVK